MLLGFISVGLAVAIGVALRLYKEVRRSRANYKKLYSQKKQSEVRPWANNRAVSSLFESVSL